MLKIFLQKFKRKDIKEKIFLIIFFLVFIQSIINIFNIVKNNFFSLIIIGGIIIIINIIKRN